MQNEFKLFSDFGQHYGACRDSMALYKVAPARSLLHTVSHQVPA